MSGHHGFRCQKCPRQYHTLKQLQRHYREVHAQAMVACPFSGCSYSVTKAKAERMVRHKEICRCNPNRIPPQTSTPVTIKEEDRDVREARGGGESKGTLLPEGGRPPGNPSGILRSRDSPVHSRAAGPLPGSSTSSRDKRGGRRHW